MKYTQSMRLILSSLLMTSLVMVMGSSCSRPQKTGESGSELSESRDDSRWTLPEYHEEKLDNGLRVLFVPDQRLPYVSFNVFFLVGSVYDPAEQLGLTQMTMRLLDKGSKGMTATQISDRLASLAAPVGASVSSESSSIGASTLARFAPELLTQLSDIVISPDFPEQEVKRQREQLLAELRRAQDQPGQLASLEFDPFLYEQHPYGKPPVGRADMIAKISKAAIRQHYAQWFGPQNAYLAVVGQYSPEIMKQIKNTFGTWKAAQLNQSSQQIPVWLEGRNERKVIRRPGLSQAEIRIGSPGIARNAPEYLALRVANTVFGETFGSRLMARLRVDLGITYGVRSFWDARSKAGAFVVATSTRIEKTEEGITEALRMLKELKENGITSAELEKAKALALGTLPAALETPEKLALQLLQLRLLGVDDSYLRDYNAHVKSLRLADVNAALGRVLEPEHVRILIVTNADGDGDGKTTASKAQAKPTTKKRGAAKSAAKLPVKLPAKLPAKE